MGSAEELEGLKLVAICPGRVYNIEATKHGLLMRFHRRVHTPLWYGGEDLDQNCSYDKTRSQTPDEITVEMVNLLKMRKYSGGTVLQAKTIGTKVAFEGIQEPELSRTASLLQTTRVQKVSSEERARSKIFKGIVSTCFTSFACPSDI